MDVMNGDDFPIGCILFIKTTMGDHFEGQIIACDRSSNIIVFQEGQEFGHRCNLRLLNARYIKEFKMLGQGYDPLEPNKCYIDLNALQAREDAALRRAELEIERIGVGVSSEAQSIFDALIKTLPVRWDKAVIVVMNEVRVSSPYLPESVVGGTSAANERVRKVIDLERKRMQARVSPH